jgi:hypothetical protein
MGYGQSGDRFVCELQVAFCCRRNASRGNVSEPGVKGELQVGYGVTGRIDVLIEEIPVSVDHIPRFGFKGQIGRTIHDKPGPRRSSV